MSTRAALRYAKATLDFALEQQKEAEVNEQMLLIANTIEDSRELQLLLSSPVLKVALKKASLQGIFSDQIGEIAYGLIDLLLENKRLNLLQEVAKSFQIIYDSLRGKETARVVSAVPLTDALKEQVLEKVRALRGKEVAIENTVDPAIIGGFVLRVGDIQYDASIAHKLQLLKRQFDNKSYISAL
ncbi:MAG: ATP synthase F1 subunit delta [Lutibacter sp.]|nr:ATP synthase F1 subunit delta [Lutibacter sp.]